MKVVPQHKNIKKAPSKKPCAVADRCATREPPLCPMQENSLKNGVWYADEAICPAEKYQRLRWIQKQKEIVRMKLRTDAGFFTVDMLKALRAVTPELKGADPDDPAAEKIWLKEHAPHHKNKPSGKLKSSVPPPKIRKPPPRPLQGTFADF